jgi:hypothetical protein
MIKDIAIISIKKMRNETENNQYPPSCIPDEPNVEILKPSGEYYYYASCSPNGQYCLFIGDKVDVFDLKQKKLLKKNFGIEFSECISDHPIIENKNEGINIDIDGSFYIDWEEFLEMKWETNHSGKLICRDKNKKIIKEYKISLK